MIYKLTFKHLFKNPLSIFLTLSAVAGALCLLGATWVAFESLEVIRVSQERDQSGKLKHGVTLFLDSEVKQEGVENLKKNILADSSVASAQIVPPEKALKTLEEQFGEKLSLVFGKEQLPTTMKLFFSNKTMTRQDYLILLNKLRSMDGVLDVDDGLSVVPANNNSTLSAKVFSWAFWMLLIVFVIISLLVSHIIRLVFESMRVDLDTLKILGASKSAIFTPILVQGLVVGVLGAILAVIVIEVVLRLLSPSLVGGILPQDIGVLSFSVNSVLGLMVVGIFSALVGTMLTYPMVGKSSVGVR